MSRFAELAFLLLLICAASAQAQSAHPDACRLLSRDEIAKATGLRVGSGKAGPPISNSLSNCVWHAPDGSRIIVTIADAQHMEVTMRSQLQSGAAQLDGIGQRAVGTAGNAETGGGYNISLLDAKGGVAVSIQGKAGTQDRAAALAKALEARR